METAHLLRSSKNAERLLAALGRARTGQLNPMTLPELRNEVGLEV
jgi:antitoxin YefM